MNRVHPSAFVFGADAKLTDIASKANFAMALKLAGDVGGKKLCVWRFL